MTDSVQTDPTDSLDPAKAAAMREELVRWAKGELATQMTGASSGAAGQAASAWPTDVYAPTAVPRPADRPLEITRIDRGQFPDLKPLLNPHPAAIDSADRGADEQVSNLKSEISHSSRVVAMQVHDRYLIAESDEGVVVIDQHALHERVIYEQLREKVLAGALETQRLLVPEPVDLSPAESAAALADQEVLKQLGVEVEPFGGGTLLVTSHPAMLGRMKPAEVLRLLVERLLAGGKTPDRRDLLDELLHMIACKAAVKAGDRLTPEEVDALVAQRHLAQDSHHCPHGRPTALVFTRDELDKQFKRT